MPLYAIALILLQFPGFVQCPPGQACPQPPPVVTPAPAPQPAPPSPPQTPPPVGMPAFVKILQDGSTLTLQITPPAPAAFVAPLANGQLILGDAPHLLQSIGITLPNGQPGMSNTFAMAQPFSQLACYYNGLRQTVGIDYTVDTSQHLVSTEWNAFEPTLRCDYLVSAP